MTFSEFYRGVSTAILTSDIDIAILSVRLSVTFRYCIETAERVIIVSPAY